MSARARRSVLVLLVCTGLGACGSVLRRSDPAPVEGARSRGAVATAPGTAQTPAGSTRPLRPGGFYKDDGPGDNPPDLAAVPDAEPRAEPLHRFANRPYQVLGREYVPATTTGPFRERGTGSWYGRRFHGQRTSSGEPYDMYAMTAAHPTLPIPSYARVTNLANGRSVVVRVNDRGPFLAGRVIDLSYTAAWKLGYAELGSASVEVESVLPGEAIAARPPVSAPASTAAPPQAPSPERPVAAIPVEDARTAGGVVLQLGAFAARENAEGLRARIARELDWLGESLRIVPTGSVFRLHAGPYRSREEADSIADRIRRALDLSPLVIQR